MTVQQQGPTVTSSRAPAAPVPRSPVTADASPSPSPGGAATIVSTSLLPFNTSVPDGPRSSPAIGFFNRTAATGHPPTYTSSVSSCTSPPRLSAFSQRPRCTDHQDDSDAAVDKDRAALVASNGSRPASRAPWHVHHLSSANTAVVCTSHRATSMTGAPWRADSAERCRHPRT